MFGFPSPTPYDLKFRLLGIPVRVNPFFWALAAFLGWNSESGLVFLNRILVWIACVFISILVHEFGHVFAGRLFGRESNIILYSFGGLAVGSTTWYSTAVDCRATCGSFASAA